MHLVDTHAHLNHEDYQEDLLAVLTRAGEAGVAAVLVPGYDLDSSRQAVAMAEEFGEARQEGLPRLYAAVGIHPHDAHTCDDDALAALHALLAHPGVVAVGETGLDYYRNLSPRERQQDSLRAHLALARETGKPILLHNRESDEDLLRLLRSEGLPEAGGVLHCFSGDTALAREAVALGLMVSAAGQVTYKNAARLREALATVPLDRLLVETDSPYLAPVPHRGRRNEPAWVAEVVRSLASLRALAPDDLAAATSANAERLLGIGANLEGTKWQRRRSMPSNSSIGGA